MVVAYHLGGRLGHGMWLSVVGWIFGAPAKENQNPESPDQRAPTQSIMAAQKLLRAESPCGSPSAPVPQYQRCHPLVDH